MPPGMSLLPSSGTGRGGFLHPAYPNNGLVFLFLLHTCEYAALQSRRGTESTRGVNLFPRKGSFRHLPKTSPWGFSAKAKGQPWAGHAKKAAGQAVILARVFGRGQQRQEMA